MPVACEHVWQKAKPKIINIQSKFNLQMHDRPATNECSHLKERDNNENEAPQPIHHYIAKSGHRNRKRPGKGGSMNSVLINESSQWMCPNISSFSLHWDVRTLLQFSNQIEFVAGQMIWQRITVEWQTGVAHNSYIINIKSQETPSEMSFATLKSQSK